MPNKKQGTLLFLIIFCGLYCTKCVILFPYSKLIICDYKYFEKTHPCFFVSGRKTLSPQRSLLHPPFSWINTLNLYPISINNV